MHIGYGVSSKLQEDVGAIDDPDCWACGYCDSRISIFDTGMFASLLSTAFFLMVATYTMLPVSTTHAIVGAIIGMTIAAVGTDCIKWGYGGVGGIFVSWVISPVLSGIMAISLFATGKYFVFQAKDPRARIIAALPGIFAVVCFCMVLVILVKSPVTHVSMHIYPAQCSLT
jgi:solute carrier family 20 (sodium-dependent phosphate transporter)